MTNTTTDYETFFASVAPRLRTALAAQFGPERGADAAQEAMVYAWEHWGRVGKMTNPAGYLFRVGQNKARRMRNIKAPSAERPTDEMPDVEPGLVSGLDRLSDRQRTAVLLVKGFTWTLEEVGELLDISPSTVQRHVTRAIERLRIELGVTSDVHIH